MPRQPGAEIKKPAAAAPAGRTSRAAQRPKPKATVEYGQAQVDALRAFLDNWIGTVPESDTRTTAAINLNLTRLDTIDRLLVSADPQELRTAEEEAGEVYKLLAKQFDKEKSKAEAGLLFAAIGGAMKNAEELERVARELKTAKELEEEAMVSAISQASPVPEAPPFDAPPIETPTPSGPPPPAPVLERKTSARAARSGRGGMGDLASQIRGQKLRSARVTEVKTAARRPAPAFGGADFRQQILGAKLRPTTARGQRPVAPVQATPGPFSILSDPAARARLEERRAVVSSDDEDEDEDQGEWAE